MRLFIVLVTMVMNLVWARPVIITNPKQLDIFSCSQCIETLGSDYEGPIPEYMNRQGMILANVNGLDDGPESAEAIAYSIQIAIIKSTPSPYKVIIFTERPELYLLPEFENRDNIFLVNTTDMPIDHNYYVWVRDFFPETIYSQKEKKWTKFHYYHDPEKGVPLVSYLMQSAPFLTKTRTMELEGGNIEVDGDKNIYISTKILDRNKHLSKEKIEKKLRHYFKANNIIFLEPLPEDGTGHVDMFMKILGPKKVLVADSEDTRRHEMLDRVASFFQEKDFEVHRIMNADDPIQYSDKDTLTYTNSFILENTVFMPTYSFSCRPTRKRFLDKHDQQAEIVYKNLGYNVVKIPSFKIISLCGAIHCLTKPIY